MSKTRVHTRGALLLSGGLALILVAAMAGHEAVMPSSAPGARATLPPSLLASLPPGEIQSVFERNGVRVVVVRPAVPHPVSESAAAMSQQAFIDPGTRQFRDAGPGDQEALHAEADSAQQPVRQSEPTEYASEVPGGGIYMEVPDALAVYSVARRADDGSIVVGHAQGGEGAVAAVRAPARAPSGREHRDVR
jgi:hypothetical protein